MSTEPSNKHQIQDVDIAITVDVSEVFGLGVDFAVKVGELVGFCFNQMSTELQLLNRFNSILIYINQFVIHYQCFNP